MFESSADRLEREYAERLDLQDRLLPFGIAFLDDALLGILPDDLVLVGAPSGIGKTQFCVGLALANVAKEKRVHFFALEAGENEIERRLKFQLIADSFYADKDRPRLGRPLFYDEWAIGRYADVLGPYEEWASNYCRSAFKNLHTFYKSEDFTADRLIEFVNMVASKTDLIIVDHVHYFDWDDRDDNRALKDIAKAARSLSLHTKKPIVLVAHLRKRDRQNAELAAGLDEFHGSSDLTKIATKVISIGSGGPAAGGGYLTYMRTAKNRHFGAATRYLAQVVFDEKRGSYGQEYKIGWANASKFGELAPGEVPSWVGRGRERGGRSNLAAGDAR